jgi:hypothetical protein
MRNRKFAQAFLLATLASIGGLGCKTVSLPNPLSSWTKVQESKVAAPANMVCIWTPDVLAKSGQAPARGLGGRIFFYDQNQKVVPAEGQLIIYGYDDSKPEHATDRVPDRKFAFTPEQLKKHHSESQLGSSYSIWVPWEKAGGEAKQVTLVPVFTSSTGRVVMGQPTVNILPGPVGEGGLANIIRTRQSSSLPTIQRVMHEDATSSVELGSPSEERFVDGSTPQMRTTTIDLPESTIRRIPRSSLGAGQAGTPNGTLLNSGSEQNPIPALPGTNRAYGTGQTLGANSLPGSNDAAFTRELLDRFEQFNANAMANNNARVTAANDARVMNPTNQPTTNRLSTPQPQDRFGRPKFPAPSGPTGQSGPSHFPTQRFPSESPFVPPS